jgi:hypothetical protein
MTPRKFMDEVRFAMRSAQLSDRTEQSYCASIRRFILFHGRRHPAELGGTEVARYLTALAEEQHVSASTQHVALCALTFLYRVVLAQPLPLDLVFVRAARSTRLPVARSTEWGHSAAPRPGGQSSANDAAGDGSGRDCLSKERT